MKKIFKILVIILLLGILGFEGFLMLKKDKTEEEPTNEEVVYEKIVSDATKTYKKNGLEFDITIEDDYYYHEISGLKDKNVQKKVNKLIKERTKKAKDEHETKEDYHIGTRVVGSFSNVLSMEIGAGSSPKDKNIYIDYVYDTLNIDLNTGNELKIDDIVLSVENFREPLREEVQQYTIYLQGFAGAGVTESDYADYSKAEDGALSVMNKFNTGDYLFSFDEQYIYFYFNDVYINEPYYEYFNKEELDEYTEEEINYLKNECIVDWDDEETTQYYCPNHYDRTYDSYLPFSYVADEVIVYDTYVKDKSIFKEDGEEYQRYASTESENNVRKSTIFEKDNNLYYFAGITDYFFDFDDESEYCDIPFEKVKDIILDDTKDMVSGEKQLVYYGLEVSDDRRCSVVVNTYIYDLDKEIIDKYKNKIYTDFLGKDYFSDKGLSFLSEYTPKTKLLSYVFNTDTDEVVDGYEMVNPEFDLKSIIPNRWVKKGQTKDDLIKNLYITTNDKVIYKDRLGISYEDSPDGFFVTYSLLYNGESVYIEEVYDIFDEEEEDY